MSFFFNAVLPKWSSAGAADFRVFAEYITHSPSPFWGMRMNNTYKVGLKL